MNAIPESVQNQVNNLKQSIEDKKEDLRAAKGELIAAKDPAVRTVTRFAKNAIPRTTRDACIVGGGLVGGGVAVYALTLEPTTTSILTGAAVGGIVGMGVVGCLRSKDDAELRAHAEATAEKVHGIWSALFGK
jgi:hypothetical protein